MAILLWLAIVGTSSAIFAAVGWMLANDFAALNKPPMETSFQVTEDFITEVTQEKQEDGSTKEVTHYDMKKVSASLKEQGLIEYDWFFRLFAWFSHADTKLTTGTFVLSTEMDYMALIRSMRTSGGKTETVTVTIPEGYTVRQIIDLLAANPASFSGEVFDSQPSCSAPYAAGKLSDAALQAALDRLNALRRIAGMPAARLDKDWCESSQYGAVILGRLGTLSHTPERPSDMDKSFYDKAYSATHSSNLYAGRTLFTAVDGWMDDSDASNVDRLGHRRWQLSPALNKVGFGYVENGSGYGRFFRREGF